MTSYKVGRIHQVSGTNRFITETQVGYRYTSGFLGVVGKISLGIFVGIVADNLDAVLVSSHSSVGTNAPELSRIGIFRLNAHLRKQWKGVECNVINNPDCEVVFRLFKRQVLKY